MSPFAIWVVSVLAFLAPARGGHHWDGVAEEPIETVGRYWQIASALDEALETERDHLPFSKSKTAAYLLSIAFHESGFLRGVDLGIGKLGRGDFGRSACLMQVQIGTTRTPEGWTMSDLLTDRVKCFRRGLSVLRASLGACQHNPVELRLAGYTSGSCDRGHRESASRVRLAERLASRGRTRRAAGSP